MCRRIDNMGKCMNSPNGMASQMTTPGNPMSTRPNQAEGDAQWDGTVLSKRFAREAEREAVLTNAVTNQHIDINMNTLLGRKPSHDIPEGSKSVRLIDPTRTVSRNHCAISYGEHGTLWLEDMGSLNGTYVVHDDEEMRVSQGTPVELDLPAHLRIGDQFFTLDAR